MIRYFVHRGGRAERVDHLDTTWLLPDSGVVVWADVTEPTEADGVVLRDAQFARMADDAFMFQDRVTGILDAHLTGVSIRLANVSRLLAVIATLFGPMTIITGLFGMNVPLPSLLGSPEHQFWEIVGIMVLSSAALFIWFRRSGWW